MNTDIPIMLLLATISYGLQLYYYSKGDSRKEFWATLVTVLLFISVVGKWVAHG
jgi:hypothetical protein